MQILRSSLSHGKNRNAHQLLGLKSAAAAQLRLEEIPHA
jgi:hypothetical protein